MHCKLSTENHMEYLGAILYNISINSSLEYYIFGNKAINTEKIKTRHPLPQTSCVIKQSKTI